MPYKIITGFLLLFGFCSSVFINKTFAQQPAFPTAEGAGAYTTGGRGTITIPTTVYEVTSLDDTNTPGTLRYAVNATATYRTIVFRVAGTIHLTSALKIKSNTTIAGQTAPGDGICLADHSVQVNGDNVIIRYIRCRLGDRYQNEGMVDGSGDDDALDDAGHHKNIIIDHCSVSWSTDEAMTFYDGDNLTLQWNIISEPLNYSYHFETGDADFERHGYGGIWGGQHASFHHNLIAHCISRTPRFNGSRYFTPLIENAELVNNVIYNWGGNNVYGGEGGNYNIIGNYYKYGPSTTAKNRIVNPNKQTSAPVLPYGKYYITGNFMDGSSTITNNNWRGVIMGNGGTAADTVLIKLTTPLAIAALPIAVQNVTDAYNDILQKAGCHLPNRDTLDERIINDVKNRTGKIIDVQGGYAHGTAYALTVNAWPTLAIATAPTDTDHDGMPDEWELQRGLNPQNAGDRNGYQANGYTHLENYLNGDSITAQGKLNTCVQTNTIASTGTQRWLFATDSSYLSLASTDSLNVVAAVKDEAAYGDIAIHYYTTATNRFLPNNKAYLNRNVTIAPANNSLNTPVQIRVYLLKTELDALMAADASIQSIADVKVLRTNEKQCTDAISTVQEVIAPKAYGSFGTYGTGYYVEFVTTSFGTFFFGADPGSLPVKLLMFNGQPKGSKVQLTWQTTQESNLQFFSVEKSGNGQSFAPFTKVNATNRAGLHQYYAVDNQPLISKRWYRLTMVDNDGRFSYSKIIMLMPPSFGNQNTLGIYPNPASNYTTISHPAAVANTTISLLSATGMQLLVANVPKSALYSTLSLVQLPAGIYTILYQNDTQKITQKLIIN